MASEYNIAVKRPSDLNASEVEVWTSLRDGNPALYSPYFHPEYTRLLGELRDDTHVVIVSQKGVPISFFPFQGPQSAIGGFARPIGAPMTDYHGFIEAPGQTIDHLEVLKQAGIGALHYSAMIGNQQDISAFHQEEFPLCLIDLSGGAEQWRAAQSSSYRRTLKSNRRRIRKCEEDIGSRRIELRSQNRQAYDQLMSWKRERLAETGRYDVLSARWTSSLLERLWLKEDGLRCDLHVLYLGDQLAAMDMGLTDGVTFHSWMVAYNPEFHSYSPGTQLLEILIDEAENLGYRYVDLGASQDSYKSVYAAENRTAHSGFLPLAGPAATLSKLYGAAEKFGEKSLNDLPGKLRRRYTQIADCDDTVSGRAKAMLDAVRTGGSR